VSDLKLMKSKTNRIIFLVILLLLLGLAGGAYQIFTLQYNPVDPGDDTYIDIVIPEASNAGQVASILREDNLIRNETIFLAYCRQSGMDGSLKAGHYKLSRSQSVQEIAKVLSEGSVVTISFTIPEGYTLDQIAELLVEKNICSRREWQKAIEADYDYEFLDQAKPGEGKNYLEGFLFPDTYVISEDTCADEIIDAMLANFVGIWADEFSAQAVEKNMTIYDTLITASIIEKEAMAADERPIISGVIRNRLDRGMLLQLDATILYIIDDDEKDIVYYEDLEIDSPYNTYKYPGLPQAPIACAGRAAIDAALNPAEHDYLYYVARGDGSHEFCRTYREFLQAKARYIK